MVAWLSLSFESPFCKPPNPLFLQTVKGTAKHGWHWKVLTKVWRSTPDLCLSVTNGVSLFSYKGSFGLGVWKCAHLIKSKMQTSEFYTPDQPLPMLIPARSPSPDITYPYPLFKQDEDLKRTPMKPNQVSVINAYKWHLLFVTTPEVFFGHFFVCVWISKLFILW